MDYLFRVRDRLIEWRVEGSENILACTHITLLSYCHDHPIAQKFDTFVLVTSCCLVAILRKTCFFHFGLMTHQLHLGASPGIHSCTTGKLMLQQGWVVTFLLGSYIFRFSVHLIAYNCLVWHINCFLHSWTIYVAHSYGVLFQSNFSADLQFCFLNFSDFNLEFD